MPKTRTLLSGLAGLLILGGGVGIATFLVFQELQEDATRRISLKTELVQLGADVENIEDFQKISKTKTYHDEVSAIKAMFVNPDTPVGFIEFLEEIGASYGFEWNISPGNPGKAEENPWPSIPFTIGASTSYPNFLWVLHQLENAPYLLEIHNVNLQGLGSEQGDVQFSMALKVYTQDLPIQTSP